MRRHLFSLLSLMILCHLNISLASDGEINAVASPPGTRITITISGWISMEDLMIRGLMSIANTHYMISIGHLEGGVIR
jgi:hypothetical protein